MKSGRPQPHDPACARKPTLASTAEQIRFLLVATLFGACLLFGGGAGGLADSLLQMLSLLLILIAAWRCVSAPILPDIPLLILFAGILLLAAIQLAPLPVALWQHLPGRAELMRQMAAVGVHPDRYSLTLSPTATERALFWTLPGLAMYLSAITLTVRERMRLIAMLIVVTVLSLLLGVAQIGSGPNSMLRFYDHEITSSAIGFFANRDHFACMLAMAIAPTVALLAALLIEQRNRPRLARTRLAFVFAALVLLLIAVPMTGSRAGIALAALAVCGSLGLLLRAGLGRRIALAAMALGVVLFFAGLLSGIGRVLPRLELDPAADPRWSIHATTLAAARHFGPLGSGLGTFVAAFQAVPPARDILPLYVNTDHAYGDYHELWLDTGWPGIVLIGVFLLWYVRRSWQVWWRPQTQDPALQLARAASISIAVVLAHSWLDFPLRTTAIVALFGLCCALLSRSVASGVGSLQSTDGPGHNGRQHSRRLRSRARGIGPSAAEVSQPLIRGESD